MTDAPHFTALGHFTVRDRDVFTVALDRETSDFAHLMNHTITIDGCRYRVLGVERFLHLEPWRKGEHVGLMVEPLI